jgi:hypothetical protein
MGFLLRTLTSGTKIEEGGSSSLCESTFICNEDGA